MTQPVKVLYLITELGIGGAQSALYRLVASLNREKFQPTVACFYNGNCLYGKLIEEMGIPVIDLSTNQKKWRLDALWRLYLLIHREQPTLLHTWLYHANIAGRVIGRIAGVPIIISSERNIYLSNSIRTLLNRITSPLSDRIFCVSQSVANYVVEFIGVSRDKISVIPNGVDIKDFVGLPDPQTIRMHYGLPPNDFIVGSVGRLHPVKNFDLLIKVFKRLHELYPRAHLMIIGDGPLRKNLESLCCELGLSKNEHVFFLGDQTDIPALLSAMDLFVLPSKHEGMPNAVLEAMAAGLPVVTTSAGGTQEIIQNNKTGILVKPDDPEALYQALALLFSDSELRRRLGNAAYGHVKENFSLDRTINITVNLYQEIISTKKRQDG